jgi:S1-C subfamily serine protease
MRPGAGLAWLSLLAALAVAATGCAHDPTLAEIQSASFARHRDVRVNGEPLDEYIRKRSAILIDGAELSPDRSEPGRFEVKLAFATTRAFGTAAATAVDARGYFLTAGHTVTRGPHTLVVHDGIGFRVLPARLVWRGDFSRGEPDLALLHVDRPLLFAFTWAAAWERRQPVAGAGANFNRTDSRVLSVHAGRLERFTAWTTRSTPYTGFFHNAPVHPGDSGGPLVDLQGRLLAVNAGTIRRFSIQRLSPRTTALAYRPNATWLQALIERDFERQHGHASAPSSPAP